MRRNSLGVPGSDVPSFNASLTSTSRRSDKLSATFPPRTSTFDISSGGRPHCENDPPHTQATHARGAIPKPPSMSTQIPFRTARIPALQRQCLFLRQQYQNRAHNLSLYQTGIPATRAFSSTPSRPSKRKTLGQDKAQTRAAAEAQVAPSPKVNFERAQSSVDAMAEDIGLLQNTIIRAPFSELKGIGIRGLTSYYWDLVKSKGTALYS